MYEHTTGNDCEKGEQRTTKMKLVLNPTYEPWREWVANLPENFACQGEVIYDARNQIRLMPAPDGTKLCVKRFHKPRFLNRFIYSCFRSPKAVRAYTNALRLQQNGIGTPTPVAYLLVQHGGLLQESYLVTLQSRLTRNFYEFRHHPLAGHEPVVEAFAQFTADLHRKGILHKDYSPGNILFDVMENGQVAFELVDINRMLFDQTVNMDKACYNFRKLWGGEDFFVLLASAYARARGWNEEECCRRTIHYWQQFWRHRT